jgi:hypothetical protein
VSNPHPHNNRHFAGFEIKKRANPSTGLRILDTKLLLLLSSVKTFCFQYAGIVVLCGVGILSAPYALAWVGDTRRYLLCSHGTLGALPRHCLDSRHHRCPLDVLRYRTCCLWHHRLYSHLGTISPRSHITFSLCFGNFCFSLWVASLSADNPVCNYSLPTSHFNQNCYFLG